MAVAPEDRTDPQPFLHAATHHVRAGWTVLPIPTGTKWPPPNGFTGAQGRLPSADDLTAWIVERGDDNAALRLDERTIGIDVDAYGTKPGAATLEAMAAEHGPLPATVRITSRDDDHSGIRLYRLPNGVSSDGMRTGWPGIEIIRRAHRYVMAPPSRHPEGGVYHVIDEATGVVGDTLPGPQELPELPAAWVAAALAKGAPAAERPARPRPLQPVPSSTDPFTPCRAMRNRLEQAVSRLGGGEARHDVATAEAFALLRLTEQGHAGGQAALATLGQTFRAQIRSARTGGAREADREWESIVDTAAVKVTADPTPEHDKGCCGPTTGPLDTGSIAGLLGTGTTPLAALRPAAAQSTADPGQDDDSDQAEPPAPLHTDLAWAATGDRPEVAAPNVLARRDGAALFYAGKVNGIFGDPETAKTWIAQAAIVEQLHAGGTAAVVDVDHNGAVENVTRLLLLGADPAVVADPDRFRLYEPEDALDLLRVVDELEQWAPTVAVFDSYGELVPMLGGASKENDDITKIGRRILSPVATAGSCVIVIDHLPKDSDARTSGYAIGGTAKKRAINGTYLHAEARSEPAPGRVGRITLKVAKDRNGRVREVSAGKLVGTFVLDSRQLDAITAVVEEPDGLAVDESTGEQKWRPTELMERVSRYLETFGDTSQRGLFAAIDGKDKYVKEAISELVAAGHVRQYEGTKRAVMHTLVTPFRANQAECGPSAARVRPDAGGRTADLVRPSLPLPVGEGRTRAADEDTPVTTSVRPAIRAALSDSLGICADCGKPALTSPCSTCRAGGAG